MINLTINGKNVSVAEGSTIMEAAELNGIHIPKLCHLHGVHTNASCRMCSVEVQGARTLLPSCAVKASDGMVVNTNSKRVRNARRVLYGLLVSDHPKECLTCSRNQNCELQKLGAELGLPERQITEQQTLKPVNIDVSPSITRDNRKCVLCRRCVTACRDIQQVGAIGGQNRGFKTIIAPAFGLPLETTNCSMCGQCVAVCPTGALSETDHISRVVKALHDPEKRVVVQVAPAVRVALGEEFGIPCGNSVTGKMAAALHEIGFDDVFDTNFAADLTIMEEGTELIHRLLASVKGEKAVLPMITSCSPGWIKHIEHDFPEQLDHLSTCKSPHTMMGAMIKTYYAEKINIDPKKLYVVSVMPCTAKKYEIQRPEMGHDGMADVDAVLTTRELARLIKMNGIDFNSLEDATFDAPLGLSSGAADIFGVTGGVMEAALRTAYVILTGRPLPFDKLHVTPIVGLEQIKTAEIKLENLKPEFKAFEGVVLKVAVTSGLAGSNILLKEIEEGKSPYHFIEVMGCPGGCIAGGGQPRANVENFRELRMKAIYQEDEGKPIRMSHENPDIQKLYADFLGEPCGHKSHEYLHTTYTKRGKFNELLKK